MLSTATDGMRVIDGEFSVLRVNSALAAMTGLSSDEALGRKCYEGFPGPMCHTPQCPVVRILSGEARVECKVEKLRRDGSRVPCILTSTPVRSAEGELIGIAENFRDIGDRRRLEEQLWQAQKMGAIGTLAGGVAHDFNNLLTGILGHANLISLAAEPGSPFHHASLVIEEAAERAAQLTGQLLGFARKGKQRNVPVDLRTTIRQVVGLLRRTIDRNIVIEQLLDDGDRYTLGDPSQVQQVFLNLAINARDAMPDGGRLTFATGLSDLDEAPAGELGARAGRYVVVSVTDTGCGIPEGIIDRIFEPFFTTKDQGKGTGMGLAMVYGIVRNHGGAVRARRGPAAGTVFEVFLPCDEQPHEPDAGRREEPAIRGSGRILVVDDEQVVLEVAASMLARLGYDVVTAASGFEAVEIYSRSPGSFDLVMLDMVMPGMGGMDCYRALARINPGVKTVLSTGYSIELDPQTASTIGKAGLVQKPYRLRDLSVAVASALAAAGER